MTYFKVQQGSVHDMFQGTAKQCSWHILSCSKEIVVTSFQVFHVSFLRRENKSRIRQRVKSVFVKRIEASTFAHKLENRLCQLA